MIRFNNKYKNITAGILLIGYLFLFTYNILHYHNYNAALDSSVIIINEDTNSHKNHFVNLDFQCPVHNVYSSLHNLLINSTGFNSYIVAEIELVKLIPQQFYIQKEFYLSNSLRAPPALFS